MNDYWCHPQNGGHPVLYFKGHKQVTRADYIDAVGAADCDPHVPHGRLSVDRRRKAKRSAKSGQGDKGERKR